MGALFEVVTVTASFLIRPFAQSINAVRQATMRFIIYATGIEAAKVGTRLNQRGNASGQPVTFRVALS